MNQKRDVGELSHFSPPDQTSSCFLDDAARQRRDDELDQEREILAKLCRDKIRAAEELALQTRGEKKDGKGAEDEAHKLASARSLESQILKLQQLNPNLKVVVGDTEFPSSLE